MNEVIEQFRFKTFVGVKELADVAAQAVIALSTDQIKGPIPNERLVRFYLSERLIPEAIDKSGTSSLFNYQHLLTIVAVKKLQGLGFPLTLIRQAIVGRSIEEIEKLIEDDVHTKVVDDPREVARFRAMSPAELKAHFGEAVQKIPDAEAVHEHRQSGKNAAAEFLEGLLFSRPEKREWPGKEEEDVLRMAWLIPVPGAPSASPPKPDRWTRHVIGPGLELHVSDDYKPPTGDRNFKQLLARLRAFLRAP